MLYEETFELQTDLPFRLDLTVWTLRRRLKNKIDDWDNKIYTRIFVVNNNIIQSRVIQIGNVLRITITSSRALKDAQPIIASTLKMMLGLERELDEFYKLSEKDTYLNLLVKSFLGVKPPRFPSIFEALVNAISCQQVTLDLGIILLNRLSQQFGKKFEDANFTQYAFPRPEDLQNISEEEIKKLGFSYQKALAIKELTQALLADRTLFDDLEKMTNEEAVIFLSKMHGIGRWSSEYVLLRGLGRIDVFPGDDVGAQKNLQQLLHLGNRPDYEEILNLTQRWQPFAGLVYFHLLLDKLQKKNLL
jgi:DNA-3-methyladenine glycosylase II